MALDVTDRDEMTSGTRLSKSVTSSQQIELYLLQIETNRKHLDQKPKSVTPGPLLAAKMLQIETDRKPPQRGHCPLCGGPEKNQPRLKEAASSPVYVWRSQDPARTQRWNREPTIARSHR